MKSNFLEYLWLGIAAFLLGLYIFFYKSLTEQDRNVFLMSIAIAAFMFGYRRFMRKKKEKQ